MLQRVGHELVCNADKFLFDQRREIARSTFHGQARFDKRTRKDARGRTLQYLRQRAFYLCAAELHDAVAGFRNQFVCAVERLFQRLARSRVVGNTRRCRLEAKDEALYTLQRMAAVPGAPPLILYEEGVMYSRKGDFAKAWAMMKEYFEKMPALDT